MTRYDLNEFRTLRWVRVRGWFGTGLVVFAAAAIAWASYGFYLREEQGGVTSVTLVGVVLGFSILGGMVAIGALLGPQAVGIAIDEAGVRLEFERGGPYSRRWDEPRLKLQGRRTDGVSDFISQGRPRASVYGRFAGLTETFIPPQAFDEMIVLAKRLGFRVSEQRGRPGWVLYTLRRSP